VIEAAAVDNANLEGNLETFSGFIDFKLRACNHTIGVKVEKGKRRKCNYFLVLCCTCQLQTKLTGRQASLRERLKGELAGLGAFKVN